jgi:hypothetical protein
VKLLTVPALGAGTDDDPIRPDLPAGTSFVGQYDAKSGTYLVAVTDAAVVAAKTGRTTLSTRKAQADAMAARSLSEGDVGTWRIG